MIKTKLYLGLVIVIMAAMISGACSQSTDETSTPVVIPQGKVDELQVAQEEAERIAEAFLKNSPTFAFDGIADSLKLIDTTSLSRCQDCWAVVFEFESRQAGYGDRTGQMLAQVITPHKATIIIEQGEITNAELDRKWDMIEQKELAIVGGPCKYVEILGIARIVSVENADPTQANCKDAVSVAFDFIPEDPKARGAYHFPNWQDRGQNLTVGGGMNPPGTWAQEQGLTVGSEHRCIRSEITGGTCTPIIFSFPDIDMEGWQTGCFEDEAQPGAELEKHFCTKESRNVDACAEIYQPVCGWFDSEKIQCFAYPCAQTYSNACEACKDPKVIYWTMGECPKPSTDSDKETLGVDDAKASIQGHVPAEETQSE